eukprot:TRINITY_DN10886_c0_g1_i1.p1 TRINITY_DN10886_c0_g1~~TRINITY_DN10886_c0_g1_i1.p1  ORF type:complete len:538 (+),score=103.12 TRINITY_DN10886_c0_g1_i1:32-1645(+)
MNGSNSTTELPLNNEQPYLGVLLAEYSLNSVVTILHQNHDKSTVIDKSSVRYEIENSNLMILDPSLFTPARAIKDHQTEDPKYLSFQIGDDVQIFETKKDGSAKGVANHRYGEFPFDYVEITVKDDPYFRFYQMLLNNELSITLAFCSIIPVTEADHLAQALLSLLDSRGDTFELLKAIIKEEIKNTTSAGNLFRANSISSKILSAYARMAGQEYLHSTLRPLITWISASSSKFEIDPSKIMPGDSIEENHFNLLQGAKCFWKGITGSVSKCPLTFRAVCHLLQEEVQHKFPQLKYAVVGGFFFLRFMCPAIVSPEGYGVIPEGTPLVSEVRRALVLVSKILQNLANGKDFGSKEAYMIPMQSFIKEHEAEIKSLFDDMASVDLSKVSRASLMKLRKEEFQEFLRYIQTEMIMYRTQLETAIKERATSEGVDPETYPPLLEFLQVIEVLGPPKEETAQKRVIDSIRKKHPMGPRTNNSFFLASEISITDLSSRPSRNTSSKKESARLSFATATEASPRASRQGAGGPAGKEQLCIIL